MMRPTTSSSSSSWRDPKVVLLPGRTRKSTSSSTSARRASTGAEDDADTTTAATITTTSRAAPPSSPPPPNSRRTTNHPPQLLLFQRRKNHHPKHNSRHLPRQHGRKFLSLILFSVFCILPLSFIIITVYYNQRLLLFPNPNILSQSQSQHLYNSDSSLFVFNPQEFQKRAFVYEAVTVARTFRSQNWTVVPYRSMADVVWQKKGGDFPYHLVRSDQFINHFPSESFFQSKSKLVVGLRKYYKNNKRVPYLPETYLIQLAGDQKAFLNRMKEETARQKPWVLKYLNLDNGKGIKILGPNSSDLQDLVLELETKGPKQSHIVQEYILKELSFRQHKFDLRCFWYVASIEPLQIFYGHGYLRVSQHHYQELDFSKTNEHLTNVAQNTGNNKTSGGHSDVPTVVSFLDWQQELKQNYRDNPSKKLPQGVLDPLEHIENQIAHIIAESIDAFRSEIHVKGARNACSILGADFIVDQNYKVWLTELQRGPGLGHEELPAKLQFNQQLLPAIVDMIEQVIVQQRNTTEANRNKLELSSDFFELIYTDDYRYNYSHMPS